MKIEIRHHLSNSVRDLIEDYIESLGDDIKDDIYSFLKKFQDSLVFRNAPYCKKIYKNIFEIRIKIKDHYRILYAFLYQDCIILLHIFKKKTNKIPKKELELAIKRLKQYD